MERSRRITLNREIREVPGRPDRLDVASRRAALESLRSTTLGSKAAGPILITGESGAGKTRLWGRLADELPSGWRFAVVQAAPAVDPVDFLSLTASRLGVAASDRLATNRLAIASALQDESADGRSWVLVVENAHHASPEVWTEIEALSACGSPRVEHGFAAVLLIGRTELTRRFAGRSFQTLANRLAGHIHLPPLDVEEASQLLASIHPNRLDAAEIEPLHRDAAGNPRTLLRLAETRGLGRSATPSPSAPAPAQLQPAARHVQATAPSPSLEASPRPVTRPEARPTPVVIAETILEPPPLVPSRPPLREEEGLIEVGWSGSLDAENAPSIEASELDESDETAVATAPLGEETIEDRYAALQAWAEWARNRGRLNPSTESTDEPAEDVDPDSGTDDELDLESVEDASEAEFGTDVRAEGEHDHAPYSQLFTRLRQPK
ncbi:MAG: ATP-binding protein [Paludisphaera borealis]|uniref:ATP-binding protein n=1 Tax=Paludisphaera borealis TaxID=1387353 RepID=UPI00283E83A0|nr:ATP-binding protein [Paludisphaera borealis]MDR3621889.1 ATP-binding protein [Paludisphaera borealis]